MSKLSTLSTRGRFLGAAAALLLTTVASAVAPTLVSADQITTRSLQLSSSAPGDVTTGEPGSATNGQKASYTFTFTPRTGSAAIQSMSFMFCESAFGYLQDGTDTPRLLTDECDVPAGFSAALAPNPTVTGVAGTWTVDNNLMAANVLRITSNTAAAPSGPVTVAFIADDTNYITNPTTTTYTTTPGTPPVLNFENTFFANVVTYTDAAWGTRYDEGTVTSAITDNVNITAKVQETLRFSVGTTAPAAQTNCEALTSPGGGSTLTLGDNNGALSPTVSYDAKSYFRVSTNSAYGTAVQYGGDTLKSGLLSIDPADASGEVSTTGTEQFGLAIDQSDAATSLTAGGTGGLGDNITAAYQDGAGALDAATIAFDVNSNTAPIALVDSTGFISCDTAAVRYIANIDNNTEAGIYRTSVNYIAVPRY